MTRITVRESQKYNGIYKNLILQKKKTLIMKNMSPS